MMTYRVSQGIVFCVFTQSRLTILYVLLIRNARLTHYINLKGNKSIDMYAYAFTVSPQFFYI